MNKDIRVSTDFPRHPKTLKLIKSLRYEGLYSLISLWAFAGKHHCKGVLDGMDEQEIELAAEWGGEAGKFVDTICKLRFLDKEGDTYALHDWKEHNGFAYYADARSEMAKQKAAKRWEKKHDARGNTFGTAERIPPSPDPPPFPDPELYPDPDLEPDPASIPSSDEDDEDECVGDVPF